MNREPSPPTLLKLLTWPYLVVVLALAVLVGWLSYRSAHTAVDEAAQQWLSTALQRVGDEIDHQRRQADSLLQAALPDGSPLPPDLAEEPWPLAQRLWMTALLHPQDRGRIGFLRSDGQILSVQRMGKSDALLEIRRNANEPGARMFLGNGSSSLAAAGSPGSVPPTQTVDAILRNEAWARQAGTAAGPSWSPLEIDGGALTQIRSRTVKDAEGQPIGALAAPFDTQPIQDVLQALKLPPQGVAFVVERSGLLVASSTGPVLRKAANGSLQRIHVQDSDSALIRAAYDRSLPHMGSYSISEPGRLTLSDPGMLPLVSSFGRTVDAGGQDWALVVAAPRAVFTNNLWNTVIQTIAATLAAVAAVLFIATWIRNRLARDVLKLSSTLQSVANGDLDTPPERARSAELNHLADALRRAQLRVRNDRILGLANREAILSRLHDRMRPGRRHNDAPLLALMAVDLNRFREVNRVHGHEAGDFVLQTIGKRLRQTLRDTDLVARWTSDEFVLVLDGVSSADNAERIRDQVERVLRDPVELGPGREAVEIDGTAGLALLDVQSETSEPEALLRSAEADLASRKPKPRGPTIDR